MGCIMAVEMCSRAFLGSMYLYFCRMNSLLEAFLTSLRTCSFHDNVDVRVIPKLSRLDVLLICVLLKMIGGRSGLDFLV